MCTVWINADTSRIDTVWINAILFKFGTTLQRDLTDHLNPAALIDTVKRKLNGIMRAVVTISWLFPSLAVKRIGRYSV